MNITVSSSGHGLSRTDEEHRYLKNSNMDTNDLTEKAYEILNLSEDINHLITVHIGAMCSRFKQEDDFLYAVLKFIQ